MDISQFLPLIYVVTGIVITQLFNFAWHWIRGGEREKEGYRKLLTDYLKDYIAPLYGLLLNIGARLHSPLLDNLVVQEQLKQLENNLDEILTSKENIGFFALVFPSNLLKGIMSIDAKLETILDGLKKNKKDADLINGTYSDINAIFAVFRKTFGLEYVEKLDKELKEMLPEELKKYLLKKLSEESY